MTCRSDVYDLDINIGIGIILAGKGSLETNVMQTQVSSLGAALRGGFILQGIAEEETSSVQCGISIQMMENTQKCDFCSSQVLALVSGATGLIIRPA